MALKVTLTDGNGSLHSMQCETCFARLAVGASIALDDVTPTTVTLTPKTTNGVTSWIMTNHS